MGSAFFVSLPHGGTYGVVQFGYFLRPMRFTHITPMQEFELIAKTFQGLEEPLAQELIELGANNVQIGTRMVSFLGNKEMMYRANFCLRTAIRVLKPIKHFVANDAAEVYEAVREIRWHEYMDADMTFAVDAVVSSEEFRHSKFVAYRVKDAVVDYFRDKEDRRPNISLTQPDLRLNLHISGNTCTLSLDSSGDSLHLRGYRVASCEAPINEVLAAGLLKLAGWKGETDLIDPFCGSGTIAIEAALMARNIHPGIFRKEYGFERWKDFDRDILENIYNDDSAERDCAHKIYAYDINLPTLEGARANAKNAGVADLIEFHQQDFREFTQPAAPSIIVTNPPYGQRLVPTDILGLYQCIGGRLKHEFKGGEAWIICSKEECFDKIGLRASVKIQLYNGKLDCELRKYQLFDGRLEDYRAAGGEMKTKEDQRRMEDRKRLRSERETFRRSQAVDGETEEDPQYALLRSKHEEFERIRALKERAKQKRQRSDSRGRYGRAHYSGERCSHQKKSDRRSDGSKRQSDKGFRVNENRSSHVVRRTRNRY